MTAPQRQGRVFLIGAGPGDPELLTVKALRLIKTADIVVHDRLVTDDILRLIPANTQRIDVGKAPSHHPFPQANINALLVSLAARGDTVVRLKGGDPFLFGRGSEEVAELRNAGIAYEVVPGITSAQGIASVTGVPLTHRGLATGVRFVTGHCRAGHDLDLDWNGLADPETTLAIYMGRSHAGMIADNLIAAGLPETMPVMVVVDGTRATQEQHFTTLNGLRGVAKQLDAGRPAMILIGYVVELANARSEIESRLMSEVSHA